MTGGCRLGPGGGRRSGSRARDPAPICWESEGSLISSISRSENWIWSVPVTTGARTDPPQKNKEILGGHAWLRRCRSVTGLRVPDLRQRTSAQRLLTQRRLECFCNRIDIKLKNIDHLML
ncbi:hypothetical protein EVAR_43376_1 [Eumeta japonica]|uniref:Uncharacterized protein n=1 Tax=Eumeta variegata TaxID=151549 RepID=A0A4C1WQF3_EUMVA|nr:hypothetical protein EVAR_43376_1 [Eumeta japonica]